MLGAPIILVSASDAPEGALDGRAPAWSLGSLLSTCGRGSFCAYSPRCPPTARPTRCLYPGDLSAGGAAGERTCGGPNLSTSKRMLRLGPVYIGGSVGKGSLSRCLQIYRSGPVITDRWHHAVGSVCDGPLGVLRIVTV